MRTITFKSREEYIIEAISSLFGGKDPAEWVLGMFTSFIPGFSKDEKDKQDPFAIAQKEYSEKFMKERKAELEAKMQHRIDMKILNFKKRKEAELGDVIKQNKINAEKRRLEKAAANEVLKRLKEENKKMAGWTGGPMTTEILEYRCKCVQQIYKDATPAEQQVADNWCGGLMAAMEEYGENLTLDQIKDEPWMQDPMVKNQVERAIKTRDDKDNSVSLMKFLAKQAGDPNFVTAEEIKDDRDKIAEIQTDLQEHETAIDELTKTKEDAEVNIQSIKNNLEKAKEYQKTLAMWEASKIDPNSEDAPEKIRSQALKQLLGDQSKLQGMTKLQPGDDGKPSTELDMDAIKKDPGKKNIFDGLKKLGYTDEQVTDILSMDNPLDVANKKFNNAEDGESDEQLKKRQDEMLKNAMKYRENEIKAASNGLAKLDISVEKIDGGYKVDMNGFEDKCKKLTRQAEQDVKDAQDKIDKHNAASHDILQDNAKLIRDYSDTPNDGTALTAESVTKAGAKLDEMVAQSQESTKHLKELKDAYKESAKKSIKTKKMEEIIKDNTSLQQKVDQLKPGDVIDPETGKKTNTIEQVDKDQRTYIKVEVDDPDNPGQKIQKRVYKPTDDKSPSFKEDMEAYNNAYKTKLAHLPEAPEPKLSENPTEYEILAHKAWENNNRNRSAEREKWSDEDYRKEHEYKDDTTIEDEDDDVDANDEGEQLSEDEKKRLEDLKKKKDDELTEKEREEIKELESHLDTGGDEEDETDSETGEDKPQKNINPAKIWKRKHNKATKKLTKSYYYCGKNAKMRQDKVSISAKEFKERMKTYKEKHESRMKSLRNFLLESLC